MTLLLKLLRRSQLADLGVPFDDNTLNRWMADGRFPKPHPCSTVRCRYWRESDIADWINSTGAWAPEKQAEAVQ